MCTTRYDAVNEGGVLVGVHSGDEGEVERAATVLEGVGADRIDRFDAKGRPRSQTPSTRKLSHLGSRYGG